MRPAAPATAATPLDRALRAEYLRLVEQRYGLRLTAHQARDLDPAIQALLQETRVADAGSLCALLAAGARPDLLETLAARLTVGETHFFRIPPQIDALRQLVLPDVIARRAPQRRLRLWSAGCSSGEETYTLAILVTEALADADAWRLDLLGTDISRPALEAARRAVYGAWSFRDTPRVSRARYFTPEGQRWRLVESIRRLARFAHLNLAADAAAWDAVIGADLDLILCRNVTIYFGREAAQALYRRLATALAPGGWLVLGPSDPAPELATGLDWVFAPNAVLWRRPLPEAPDGPPAVPGTSPARSSGAGPAQPPAPRAGARGASARPAVATARSTRGAPPAPAGPSATRAALEERAAARPLDADAYLRLGMFDLDGGAAERALDSLRRATFLAPDSALAHYSLGRAWERLGDGARARTALVQARRLLGALADEAPVAGGEGLLAGELRNAVAAELRALERAASPGVVERR
jgi:chemotaxis protein methyltransferase CheR